MGGKDRFWRVYAYLSENRLSLMMRADPEERGMGLLSSWYKKHNMFNKDIVADARAEL